MAKDEEVAAFISHHGVKGMHWGIRTKRTPKKTSSDYKQTAPYRKKPVASLTNKQLKSVNERLQLETKYKQLNPNIARHGRNVAAEIMAGVGLAAGAYTLFHSPAGQALINIGKKRAKQLKFPGM